MLLLLIRVRTLYQVKYIYIRSEGAKDSVCEHVCLPLVYWRRIFAAPLKRSEHFENRLLISVRLENFR